MSATTRKKNSRLALGVLLTAIIVLIALFLVYKNKKEHKPAISYPGKGTLEQVLPQKEYTQTEEAYQQEPDNTTSSFTPPQTTVLQAETPPPCEKGAKDILLFLQQLEEKEYIQAYEINGGLTSHLNAIIIKVLNNPPSISQESEDLLSIIKNAAHFYQVLGPKDLSLLKDILTYENENTESILASFYNWHTTESTCDAHLLPFRLPLKKLYEYASYFLNTLGGQSYLFRRDSGTRLLIEYYSLLIIHQAEQKGLNKYAFSTQKIRLRLTEEIASSPYLVQKNKYLATLAMLGQKTNQ